MSLPPPPPQPVPSTNWEFSNERPPGPDHWLSKDILAFVQQFDVVKLGLHGSSLRHGTDCVVSERYTHGTENIVRELVFNDGVVWIARLSLKKLNPKIIESEVATMRYVKANTSIPIPEVYSYESSGNNDLGCQYIIMEAVYGRAHCHSESSLLLNVPEKEMSKVCMQLADYVLQLNQLRFPRIGSLYFDESDSSIQIGDVFRVRETFKSCTTSHEYFYSIASASLKRAIELDDSEHRQNCFLFGLLQRAISTKFRRPRSESFPLAHPDFHARNILFDDNFNIVAILDWSYSHTIPIEEFCSVPGGGYIRHSPPWDERSHIIQNKQCCIREAFLKALRIQESKTNVATPLLQTFEDPRTKMALVFGEYYQPPVSELFRFLRG
jgi:hypothetical protein